MKYLHAYLLCLAFVSSCFAGASDAPSKAMWIYKTEAIMESASERAKLFEFCQQRHITNLFWQVHFQRQADQSYELKNQAQNHAFLAEAHSHGLHLHALGGDPSHALRKNHVRVLSMVDTLIQFNKESAKDQYFDGLHLDIEPHGLPEWKKASQAEKCDLLTQFVEVHTLAAERLHADNPTCIYGADIVFWLDKTEPDGSATYPVTFRGVTKDAAKFLLDVVDHVGIMSYRNTAEGKNGINALVEKTITYADKSKGRAYVGVKMANIGPKLETFYGQTETAMLNALKPVQTKYGPHRGYAGLAFFMYEAYKVMPQVGGP